MIVKYFQSEEAARAEAKRVSMDRGPLYVIESERMPSRERLGVDMLDVGRWVVEDDPTVRSGNRLIATYVRGVETTDATTDAMNDVEHLPPVVLIAAQADFGRWLEANGDELREELHGNEYDAEVDLDVIVAYPKGGLGDVYVFDRWAAFAAYYAVVRGQDDGPAALRRWWDAVPVLRMTEIRGRRP